MIWDLCKNGEIVRSASSQVTEEFKQRIYLDEPEFHPVTEYLNQKLTIKAGQVTQGYTIKKYPLEEAKLRAIQSTRDMHAEAISHATGDATVAERDTWSEQAREAKLVIDGETDPLVVPFLHNQAELLGLTLQQMAASVNGKAIQFATITGKAGALLKGTIAQVKSATSVVAITTILIASREQADAMIEAINNG